MFQRTELLIGSENLEKLKNSHVIVFGMGGVGGYVVEALVRSGVGTLTVVDFDVVDVSNLNRQIIATRNTIGRAKVDLIEERAKSINPDIKINILQEMFSEENSELFFNDNMKYDYVVDAIDLITHKIKIIEMAEKYKIKIISSMGTANKMEPLKLRVSKIEKTIACRLAKIIRKELRKRRIGKNLKVLYSLEEVKKVENQEGRGNFRKLGSISFVPATAGFIIASEVIKDLIKNETTE